MEKRLYPAPPVIDDDEVRPEPDWEHVARELRKKNVTLNLLWKEYQKAHADKNPYQYTWFCDQFREWESRKSVTMRLSHKAGEKMFVDWAGTKVPIVDAKTGEVAEASIFVATLGLSSYTYVEAFENEKTPAWIAGHTNACRYFEGVCEVTVPDNPKTGVTKADYCEPDINPVYYAWGEHKEKKKKPGHGRNGVAKFAGAKIVEVKHPELNRGDKCPSCPAEKSGKVYPTNKPNVVIRLIGMTPIHSMKILNIERPEADTRTGIFTSTVVSTSAGVRITWRREQ